MFYSKPSIEYGVIGLGRFGFALAQKLIESGKDVLVMDKDEIKIKQIRSLTENALVVQQLDRETLEETGIQNCETVVVCIGERIDTNILTTLNVINMGVPRVIAKAMSYEQGCILEKLGAQVVYPERDMAIKVANKLLYSKSLDFIDLHAETSITELKITSKLGGKTIIEAGIRKKYNLNVIAIEKDMDTITEITPDLVLVEGDSIVVIGKKDNIKKFEESFL